MYKKIFACLTLCVVLQQASSAENIKFYLLSVNVPYHFAHNSYNHILADQLFFVDYFNDTSEQLIVNGTARLREELPMNAVIEVLLYEVSNEEQRNYPVFTKTYFLCSFLEHNPIYTSLFNSSTFPVKCPISARDYEINNYIFPNDLITEDWPMGRFELIVNIFENPRKRNMLITFSVDFMTVNAGAYAK